jgi:RND superfamily putative drug exporter
MFTYLGKIVTRTWPIFLVLWLALLAAGRLTAPPWQEVAQDTEFASLPADAPSRRSGEIFAKAFPEDRLASNIVIVLERPDDGGLREQDRKFIEDVLESGLRQIAEDEGGLASELLPAEPLFPDEAAPAPPDRPRSIIARIRTPNAPGSGALLTSQDGQAGLVAVELTTDFLSTRNWPTIAKVENLIQQLQQQGRVPPGLDLFVTGSAVLGRDRAQAQLSSARATEVWTVVLVVALLVLIYRAPLLALIPLITVYLAVQVSLHLLALLARAGYVTLFQGIEIYITVLAYGAGVDYCLFLTARYKEELDGGACSPDAVAGAIGKVGAALAASAGTVMCGIGMMVFAEFGKFRQAGIGIPLSLFIVLCATLTFSAAFLRLTGRWVFWPQVQRRGPGGDCGPLEPVGRWGRWLGSGGFQRGWEKMGQLLRRRPTTVWLTTIALMAPFALVALFFYGHASYDLLSSLPADAPSVAGTRALQGHFPAGLMGATTVLLVNPGVDFSTEAGEAMVGELTERLTQRRDELGLADIRSLTTPLGVTEAADRALASLTVPAETVRETVRREALAHYVTDFGERAEIGTRLDLVLAENPFSRRSIDNLNRIERTVAASLPPGLEQGTQLFMVGPTAGIRDLRAVIDSDQVRIELLVLAGVFVILLLLLRKPVVSLYLLVSVLFSYYVTLGVAYGVFWLLDPAGFAGIDWKVTVFLFTILIAVGEDYNIFLMARVEEEQARHGPVRGVTEALARTGPIISSCGLIMAGTFASLLAGSLPEMKQLGFALAFGVLLDTFVVRPILVPAFLIVINSRRLRPGSQGQRRPAPPAPVEHPTPASSSS